MARSYTVSVSNAAGTANFNFCGVNVSTATTVRPKVFEFVLGGADTTPNDYYTKWVVGRHSAAPTGGTTGAAGSVLDSGDPASVANGYTNNTGGANLAGGTILFLIGLNYRATFRWVAVPGKELVGPATANNGVGLGWLTQSSAANYTATLLWEE